MPKKTKGHLLIIGGHEDKKGDCVILKEVARRARNGLVIVSVASQEPDALIKQYKSLFRQLGVKEIDALDIREREDASQEANVHRLDKPSVLFFTGGDQLRITSQIGDSPVFRRMKELYGEGVTIAGTSAGAAAMSETMLIGGKSDNSEGTYSLQMAPGLGFVEGVVIDSHFAERGRLGRILGAVAQNPRNLGLGIDEDTAILIKPDRTFTVIGSGAVYVLDGSHVPYSNLSEKHTEGILTAFDVKLHVLGAHTDFDLKTRRPKIQGKIVDEILEKEETQV